jgi:cytochrome P450
MILTEALRLYPPAWAMGRRLTEDMEIGDYVIPAGATAIASQYIVHHDPRWYPDPWRFDPERWRPSGTAPHPKHAYFPFGAGPRMCVGEDFAWMEGILVLATIARRWRLRLASGYPIALEPRITLRPKHGIRMTTERRT